MRWRKPITKIRQSVRTIIVQAKFKFRLKVATDAEVFE
jgi:hypothetical protein